MAFIFTHAQAVTMFLCPILSFLIVTSLAQDLDPGSLSTIAATSAMSSSASPTTAPPTTSQATSSSPAMSTTSLTPGQCEAQCRQQCGCPVSPTSAAQQLTFTQQKVANSSTEEPPSGLVAEGIAFAAIIFGVTAIIAVIVVITAFWLVHREKKQKSQKEWSVEYQGLVIASKDSKQVSIKRERLM